MLHATVAFSRLAGRWRTISDETSVSEHEHRIMWLAGAGHSSHPGGKRGAGCRDGRHHDAGVRVRSCPRLWRHQHLCGVLHSAQAVSRSWCGIPRTLQQSYAAHQCNCLWRRGHEQLSTNCGHLVISSLHCFARRLLTPCKWRVTDLSWRVQAETAIRRAARGGLLSGSQLVAVASVLRGGGRLRSAVNTVVGQAAKDGRPPELLQPLAAVTKVGAPRCVWLCHVRRARHAGRADMNASRCTADPDCMSWVINTAGHVMQLGDNTKSAAAGRDSGQSGGWRH